MSNQYPVYVKWTQTLNWILDTVEKFPKGVRFTLSTRVSNLALDVMEDIIEAIYTKKRIYILKRANVNLEKLRVMLRICEQRHYFSVRQYEFVMKEINETGKMLGGWNKYETAGKSLS